MPQLMPLNWLVSVFMMSFISLMVVKMYSIMNNQVKGCNEGFYSSNMIWLW